MSDDFGNDFFESSGPVSADIAPKDETHFEDDIYKKWFKTKSRSGFLSLRQWLEAGKVSIDIGEVNGKELQNTLVWANAIQLAIYLRSIAQNTALVLYPQTNSTPSPESFVHFGGSNTDKGPVSRILKIHYWKQGDSYDGTAFSFKCGHFKARTSSSGAFIPDMSAPLSTNMIKMSRTEMADMSYRIDLAIQHFAFKYDGDVFSALNGHTR